MTSTTSSTPRVTVASLRSELRDTNALVESQRDSLAKLELAIEDRGWRRWGNDHKDVSGLKLESLKTVSGELRSWIVAGGIMKRISNLRGDNAYGDGVGFKNFAKATTPFTSENNVAKLFSVDALLEINRAHFTDGTVVFLVHKQTKEIVRMPFENLGVPYGDPDDPERVWFVKRQYVRVTAAHPAGEEVEEYIVTDTAPASEKGRASVRETGEKTVDVNTKYTAVVWKVNGQTGWPLGIPDGLASLQWAEKWTDYLKGQSRFAEALATIAWQYKSSNEAAALKAKTAARKGSAETALTGDGFEMLPQKGNSDVSFSNAENLAGAAAAAADVTVESVLAKGDTAANQAVDPSVRKAIAARRSSATAFFKRIGKLLGAPNLEVIWPDLAAESPFREAQMIVAAWGTGLYEAEEIRGPLAQRVRIELKEGDKAPEGVLLPNNKDSLPVVAEPAGDGKGKPGGKNSQGNDELGVGKLSDGDNEARDKGEV